MTEQKTGGTHIEYGSVDELLTEYRSYMKDPKNVDAGANYLLNSLIDETILGVVFEVHYACKSGVAVAVDGKPEDTKAFTITDAPDLDVFGASTTAKKTIDCVCPNCDRLVAASRFAPHLEKCMGKVLQKIKISVFEKKFNYFVGIVLRNGP